jgi:spore coat polysaccharide biosynthesis predicted glycosyltransferase SpsG
LVLFFVAAGVHIGIGHVKRCTQLAIDLREQKVEVLLCLEADAKSIEITKKEKIKFSIIDENNNMFDIIRDHPDAKLIILDLIQVSKKDTLKFKELNPQLKILALDYFDMQDSNVNTIINLHNHNKEFSRPVDPSVKYLEGPAYGILRNEFNSFLINEHRLSKTALKNMLITFGGSDPRQHTLAIISQLDEILNKLPIRVTIIIGPNFVHKNDILKALKNVKSQCEVIQDPSDMSNLMKNADICICGSGTTILELSALGTPALVVPQSNEELEFSRRFESAGFASIIGTPESIDKEKLITILKNYYDHPDQLAAAGSIGYKLCDGKGKERIINEITTLIKD